MSSESNIRDFQKYRHPNDQDGNFEDSYSDYGILIPSDEEINWRMAKSGDRQALGELRKTAVIGSVYDAEDTTDGDPALEAFQENIRQTVLSTPVPIHLNAGIRSVIRSSKSSGRESPENPSA